MKRLRNFAIIFDLPKCQVLVTKEINQDEDSDHVANIKVDIRYELDGAVLSPSLTMSYESKESRDKDFQDLTVEKIEGIVKGLDAEVLELFPNAIL